MITKDKGITRKVELDIASKASPRRPSFPLRRNSLRQIMTRLAVTAKLVTRRRTRQAAPGGREYSRPLCPWFAGRTPLDLLNGNAVAVNSQVA